MSGEYYVYLHTRLDTGEVFYVGKGKGRRATTRWSRNVWWNRVAAKAEWISSIVQDGMSESDAHLLEMWLIAKFRHCGVSLCNIDDGGGGRASPQPNLRKPVVCSNGMRFPMVSSAAKWAGGNGSSISAAANGKKGEAYGFAWWYEGDDAKEYVNHKKRMAASQMKKIERSDGVVYRSLTDAAKSVNGSIGNISVAARTCGLVRYGFTWRYIE